MKKITEARWGDADNDTLSVMGKDENDENECYVIRFSEGLHPAGKELWERVRNEIGTRGIIPFIPPAPLSDDEIKEQLKEKLVKEIHGRVKEEVDKLGSPYYAARGERDPDFEEKRLRAIRDWIEIEHAPDFPFNVSFPEVWEE